MRARTSAFFSGRGALALDAVVEPGLDVGAALVGGGLVAVDQHDLDAGVGGDGGDAGAHHAGAEDAELPHALVGLAGRDGALLQRLLAEEERADHRRRTRGSSARG